MKTIDMGTAFRTPRFTKGRQRTCRQGLLDSTTAPAWGEEPVAEEPAGRAELDNAALKDLVGKNRSSLRRLATVKRVIDHHGY
jgi:hypothetical protein